MDIRPSSVAEMRSLAGALFAAHYEEVAKNRQTTPLDPHWGRYEALEDSGQLIALAAWEGDRIIGYSVCLVTENLHYGSTVMAHNDVLYVEPAHRRSRLGLQLMRESERLAVARGAKRMTWHAKEGTALAAILPKIGYGVHEIVFARDF